MRGCGAITSPSCPFTAPRPQSFSLAGLRGGCQGPGTYLACAAEVQSGGSGLTVLPVSPLSLHILSLSLFPAPLGGARRDHEGGLWHWGASCGHCEIWGLTSQTQSLSKGGNLDPSPTGSWLQGAGQGSQVMEGHPRC